MVFLEIFIGLGVLAYFIYRWSTKEYNTFAERGLPHKKPIPLFGNAFAFIQNKQSLHKIMLNLYRDTKQHKVFGYYNFLNPFFIVQDPELIKQITIKDFDYFPNHQRISNIESDPVLGSMLSIMQDQEWKDMRNTMTPIFTGAKMRAMFTLMNDCFAESMKYLHAECTNNKTFDIELKECFSRLSNDLIATTAFGLKTNSYVDKDNVFYKIGAELSKTRVQQAIKFIVYSMVPKLAKILRLKLFDEKSITYFVRLVVDAMEYREKNNIIRPDMINLLMEAKKESTQHWTDNQIAAQCFIFFFAAFENNANLLCTTCYELMENPDVQQKLYEEISEIRDELEGKTLTYDALNKMKYLDMVVSESLRKWTLAPMTDRECSKDYTLKDEDGNVIVEFKKGDRIWIHLIGLHWDEQYFENPEVFDPERFSDDNKHNIKPFTYLPFGAGPRICIGSRYALMQAKAMLYYLLLDFEIQRSEKTFKNLMDDLRGFSIVPKSGFWFKLKRRPIITEL